jgi:hypothetical protein
MESKAETKGSQRATTPPTARATPSSRRGMVWAPGPPPDIALPPIYSPRRENPKDSINFLENILQSAAAVDARLGGSISSSRHPTGEGNHHRRPSPPPCLPPLSWEFRDSSHGDGLTEGLDGGDDGSGSGLCQRRHLGYPGSGPSTPEVKPLLPACFLISFTVVTVLLELFV